MSELKLEGINSSKFKKFDCDRISNLAKIVGGRHVTGAGQVIMNHETMHWTKDVYRRNGSVKYKNVTFDRSLNY